MPLAVRGVPEPFVEIGVGEIRSLPASSGVAPASGGRFAARTTAPTAAISRSSEAASKGIRKSSSISSPIASGEPKPSGIVGPSLPSDCQGGADHRDRELDEERTGEQRGEDPLAGDRVPQRLLEAADVGGDEDVEDHHRAGVDDHLGGRDELGVQDQEEAGQREQVHDQREHAVEGIAERDHRHRARRGHRSRRRRRRPAPSRRILLQSRQARPVRRASPAV